MNGWMRAWDVRDGTLQWAFQPVPDPGPRQTLVQVTHAGLCGSDLAKLTQSPIPSPPGGWRPGHEIVGLDYRAEPARPVVIDPLVGCQSCEKCAVGRHHLCPGLLRIGWDLPGGFAAWIAVPARSAQTLPDASDPMIFVLADPLAVAIHGLRCMLSPRPAGRLVVIGAGTIGTCTAAYAAARGWHVTLAGREHARDWPPGADRASPAAAPPREAGYDAAVDAATGRDDRPVSRAIGLVRDGGHIVVQNAYEPGVRLGRDLREIFRRSLTITGSFSYCRRPGRDDFAEAVTLLAARPQWASLLLRAPQPLSALPHVLRHRSPGKTILTP